MKKATPMTLPILGMIVLVALVRTALGSGPETWTVVDGQLASYINSKSKEIVLKGKLIVEDYGNPNELYFRVPYNYWLVTGRKKIALGINDRVFPPMDKKMVEVKGKMQKDQNGKECMFVGWIRLVGNTAEPPAGGDSTNRADAV